jgi:hypothetical protein
MKILTSSGVIVTCLALSVGSMGCQSNKTGEDKTEEVAQAEQRPRREIPPEAFDACNGKKEADACTVKHGGHEMKGTCAPAPDGDTGGRLACRPERPEGAPPPDGKGPPQS